MLWAEENSRDALFAAMRRREAYGTSGPRMVVRFFGGWDFPADLCDAPTSSSAATPHGVPMGGDLPPRPAGAAAPTLRRLGAARSRAAASRARRCSACRSSRAGSRDGQAREQVFDVAGDADNGATVDLATCAPHGRGFDELCTVWRDPDFDPRAARLLLRAGPREPDLPLEHLRVQRAGVDCADPGAVPQGFAACCDPRYPEDDPGTRLDLADLVHAGGLRRAEGARVRRALLHFFAIGLCCSPSTGGSPHLAATGTLGTAIPQ